MMKPAIPFIQYMKKMYWIKPKDRYVQQAAPAKYNGPFYAICYF